MRSRGWGVSLHAVIVLSDEKLPNSSINSRWRLFNPAQDICSVVDRQASHGVSDSRAGSAPPIRRGYNQRVHYVYIVQCVDGTLYTGYAVDLSRRIDAHNAGRGAKYTAGRRPVSLVYSECFDSKSAALKREHELKRRTRIRKQALIASLHDPR